MKNIKIFIPFLVLFLFSCENKEEVKEIKAGDNVQLTGEIKGGENQPLVLEYVDERGKKEISSTTLDEEGKFQLSAKIDEISIYQLRVGMGERKVIPLTLVPKDQIKIVVSYSDFEIKPQISGTEWAKPLSEYMSLFNQFALKQVELMKRTDLTQDQQLKEFLIMRSPIDEFSYQRILKDPANPVNLILLTSLTPAMGFTYWDKKYLECFQKMSTAFNKKFQGKAVSISLDQQTKQLESAYNDYLLTNKGDKDAPEIALNNPDGKEIKLSSLKGKVVLIDFWASWCGPCRKENPNVVRIYNQYKNKGFVVFSVSLDRDINAWKQAIQQDGLNWPYHVSDLKHWNTPLTQTYQFNTIPFTVLVNKKGKIVGTNLRGESLEQKLKELL